MAYSRTQAIRKPARSSSSSPDGLPTSTRIRTRAVVEAYVKPIRDANGRPLFCYRPLRGRWLSEDGKSCDGLMALVAARTGRPAEPPSGLAEIAESLGVALDYCRGFLFGWSGYPKPRISAGVLVAMGWLDGRAAAREVGLETDEDPCRGR